MAQNRPGPPNPGDPDAPFIAGPVVAGMKEHWELVRKGIEHEDMLFNHRLTWLLLMQGFLITIFAVGQGAMLNGKPAPNTVLLMEIVLAAVLLVGVKCCSIIARTLALAGEHQVHLREWWMETYKSQRRGPRVLEGGDDSLERRSLIDKVRVWVARLLEWDTGWWMYKSKYKYKESRASDDAAMTKPPEEAEPTSLPPVHGHFDVPAANNVMIAAWFKRVNLILAVCSLLIGAQAFTGQHGKPDTSAVIERKDAVTGASYKVTFELDAPVEQQKRLTQELVDKLTK